MVVAISGGSGGGCAIERVLLDEQISRIPRTSMYATITNVNGSEKSDGEGEIRQIKVYSIVPNLVCLLGITVWPPM